MIKNKLGEDSDAYKSRKKIFGQLLTIYGRNPVLEAMSTPGVEIYRLHLADSNKPAKVIEDMTLLAQKRGVEILYHNKAALSRISKNQKQDQGVAVDLKLNGFQEFEAFMAQLSVADEQQPFELIALDSITNPQNLGMIIRSVCASPIRALLIPKKGCAKLDSLVIKASAGTLFKAAIIRCDNLAQSLQQLKQKSVNVIGMEANAALRLGEYYPKQSAVFVLGNETEGLSNEVRALCDSSVKIPMLNGVGSLNVAITASLIAFRNAL